MDAVPIDDRGLLLGDGLFETLLADRGVIERFEQHASRLIAGCAVVALPAPEVEALRLAAGRAIDAAGLSGERAAVRLTWTAGSGGRGLDRPATPAPRLIATAAPAPLTPGPIRLITAQVRRNDHSPASRLKTLAYLDNVLARREAHAAGADEALMLNTTGDVACAAAANVFWIADGRLFTPSLDCGVLAGVVRAAVLRAAAVLGIEAVEVRAPLDVLLSAEAVFLTNSLIGLRPVSDLDGRGFSEHPLIARLAGAYRAMI